MIRGCVFLWKNLFAFISLAFSYYSFLFYMLIKVVVLGVDYPAIHIEEAWEKIEK